MWPYSTREVGWPNGGCATSRSSSLGSSPGWGIAVCCWERHFTLTVPLSTQLYIMGTGELNGVGNLAMD